MTKFEIRDRFDTVKPRIPGVYGVKNGYIYAICCEGGLCKIGSSRNPRIRISEQVSPEGLFYQRLSLSPVPNPKIAEILLSVPRLRVRQLERLLHDILSPLRFGYHPMGECFQLSPPLVQHLEQAFKDDFSQNSLTRLIDAVRSVAPLAGPLALINKTVRLSEEQIAGLQAEAALDKRDNWTSLIRIAVDEMLEARRKRRAQQQPEEAAA